MLFRSGRMFDVTQHLLNVSEIIVYLEQRLWKDKTCLIYTFAGLIKTPVIPFFT